MAETGKICKKMDGHLQRKPSLWQAAARVMAGQNSARP
jgi:hypothetical protein